LTQLTQPTTSSAKISVHAGQLIGPEGADGGQHPALVGDGLGHDDIEGADAQQFGAASGVGAAGVGYLLKDRVADVEEFVEALSRVAAGGTALDPEVVTQLLGASRRSDGLGTLTAREREVLALMAEGRSNAAIAGILVVSERSVEKHVGNIFSKLGLAPSDADHRRVLAVLRYLES